MEHVKKCMLSLLYFYWDRGQLVRMIVSFMLKADRLSAIPVDKNSKKISK